MEKVLNKLGEQLLDLKRNEQVDKNNPLISIFKSINAESKELMDKLMSKKTNLEEFEEILKNDSRFIYTEDELKEKRRTDVINLYATELSKKLKYYDMDYDIEANNLMITRRIGIGSTYYCNFMGVDLSNLKHPIKKNYRYRNDSDWEIKEYKKNVALFENFAKARLCSVINKIYEVLTEKELITEKKDGFFLSHDFEGRSKKLKSFVNHSLILHIDLNKANNFKSNVKKITDIFLEIDRLVDRLMAYEMYE